MHQEIWTGHRRDGVSLFHGVWGLEFLKGHSLTHLAVGTGCRFSMRAPTTWYLLGSSQHGAWELRARVPKEGDKQKSDCFMTQPSGGQQHHLHEVSLPDATKKPHEDSWQGWGGHNHPPTPWRCVQHTEKDMWNGFVRDIFRKSAHMKIKVFQCAWLSGKKTHVGKAAREGQ